MCDVCLAGCGASDAEAGCLVHRARARPVCAAGEICGRGRLRVRGVRVQQAECAWKIDDADAFIIAMLK